MTAFHKHKAPRAANNRWLGMALGLLVIVALALPAAAEAATKKKKAAAAKPPDRYASLVIEADTGYVLSEKNADKSLHPASLTKMMTLYLTFEAIKNGRMTKNTRVPVSKHAAFQEPSELGLAAGSTIRIEDAIYGLVTKSANDAAVVLAEAIGGSESKFAEIMTRRARELGMKNTTFKNASGLHNKAQVSTARDMATLAQAILRDHPRDYKYFSTKTFSYAGRQYANHNKLMNTYVGMDGFKTGFVSASGFNLVASARRNGTRLIGVVFGGQTSKSRNDHMAQLLDLGFERLNDVRVANLIALRQQNSTVQPLTAASAAAVRSVAHPPVVTASSGQKNLPRFDAVGLVTEQGDREDDSRALVDAPGRAVPNLSSNNDVYARTAAAGTALRPPVGTASGPKGWAVQVGAFSSHESGMLALKTAHKELPAHMTQHAEYIIVPLMTNRGVIYRARMTGLSHDEASAACRALKNTCIVLTAQ